MILKIFSFVGFLGLWFGMTWYGTFTGKIPAKGVLFGWNYDSFFLSTLLVQLRFVWFLILMNLLFTSAFRWGMAGYKDILIVTGMWIAAGPIAIFLFNTLILKEKIDIPMILGLILAVVGILLVSNHKEISALLQS